MSAGPTIALFGGSFDPFHNGHRAIIEAVLTECRPDRFIVMPTHNPPHRPPLAFTDAERLVMTRAGCADLPGVEVSDYELTQTGTQYTFNTVAHLRAINPGARILLVLGSDSFEALPTWHRPQELLAQVELVLAQRQGKTALPAGLQARVLTHRIPDVSSTAIRTALEAQEIPTELPSAVREFLKKTKPRAKTDQ